MISDNDKRMANLIPRNEPPITKREWFAGLAMQGLLHKCEHNKPVELHAEQAVAFADALIAELAKEKQ